MTATPHAPHDLRPDLRHALDLCREGPDETAALAYRRLVGIGTFMPEELDLLARLAGRLGLGKEEAGWCHRAAATAPTVERLTALGKAHLAQRAFDEAASAFERALELDETRPRVWLALGEVQRELGRWEAAAVAYGRATQGEPRLTDAWIGLALVLISLGHVEQGLIAARTALAIDGAAAEAHRALALAHLRAQHLTEAEQAALTALEHAPGYPEGTATLALVRMMQERLADADALFASAIGAKPTLAEAMGNHAVLLARLGREAEALRTAAFAGKLKPFLPAPFHLMGTLLRRAGNLDAAATAFEHALSLAPDNHETRANLADTLRLAGNSRKAATVCLTGLEMNPDHIGLLTNLGAALQELGDTEGALAAYGHVLDLQPGLPEVENNIARLHQEAGHLDKALTHLHRAAAGRPGDETITSTLISVLLDAGRLKEARVALDATPPTAARLRQIAHIHERTDRRPEAEQALRRAITLAPDEAETWQQAATLWLRTGERARAVPYARRSARLDPGSARAWALFGQSLNGLALNELAPAAPNAGNGALAADLLDALRHPATENAHLLHATLDVIGRNPAVARLRAAAAGDDPDAAVAALLQDVAMHGLARDRLLQALLETTVVSDHGFERVLTVLRRVLLGLAEREGLSVLDHPDWLPFLCALAGQCFLNEYAYFETPEETVAAAHLDTVMLAAAKRQEAPVPAHIALYAAYRPLAHWPKVADLVAYRSWPEPIVTLLLRQVREPVTEELLATLLEHLTPIRDTVSQAVRTQYEENPYPRWRHAGLLDAPRPVPEVLRAILPHVRLNPGPWWKAPRVLIAGCGTGRESVWAANHMAGADVLAVDLSLASLSYAQRQSEALDLNAITYAQADLLELGSLDRRFDVVQCVGVLHHMADPLAGWRVLAGLLEPHGVMKVGLYSAHARAAVRAARAFIAERGYTGTPADIRRLRQDLLEMPANHPDARTLAPIIWSPDFYNVSTCRDLLFHVQEHQTTLPEIASWLEELGLEFLGFQHDDPAITRHYRDRFPDDPDMVSLDLWNRFEMDNPDTFAGLYQFWVRPRCEAAP